MKVMILVNVGDDYNSYHFGNYGLSELDEVADMVERYGIDTPDGHCSYTCSSFAHNGDSPLDPAFFEISVGVDY